MSAIEGIADTEFDEVLEHDLVESRTDGQGMSEEMLGVIVVPADDMLRI